MKLSTLALAAILAGSVGGMAFANTESDPPMEMAESAAPASAPDDTLTPEDSAALGGIAPEAMAGDDAAVEGMTEAEAMAEADDMPIDDMPVAEPVAPLADAPAAPEETVTWEDFDDPSYDPSAPAEPTPLSQSTPVAKLSAKAAAIPLGPLGVDEKGVEGRIHTVSSGETLWDISEAYLGTPWVWPSVWHENDGIDNPHVIEPGDRIWITSNEMRRISDEEADQMVAAIGDDSEMDMVSSEDDFDLAADEPDMYETEEPLPASVEDEAELPVTMSIESQDSMTGEVIILPKSPESNFATADLMEKASEIMEAPSIRAFLTQGDEVYLAFGEGEVQVGDEFEIFREVVKVRDIATGAVLGYHYDELGWLKITRLEGESSVGVIHGAFGEIERGDQIITRNHPPREIALRKALDEVEGSIVFTPGIRWMRGQADSVYLNVGAIHGIEVGTQLQVIDRGMVKASSKMPDTIIAELVVIGVEPETAVAYITETDRELEVGDFVRGVMAEDQFVVH